LAQLELDGNVSKTNDITTLKHQNEKLKLELDGWKKKLVDVGVSHGVRNLSTTAAVTKPTVVPIQVPDNKTKEPKKAQPKKTAGMNPSKINSFSNHEIICSLSIFYHILNLR